MTWRARRSTCAGQNPKPARSRISDLGWRQRVEIVDGSLRDLTYIAANIRPHDWREIAAQLPEGATPTQAAAISFAAGRSWVATWDGQPVAGFGISPISTAVLSIWAWGTNDMLRAVPSITRYVDGPLVKEWDRLGINRVEARSIADHHAAHRWLRALGWTEAACPEFGRSGEDFILFAQTRKGWTERHVLRKQDAGPQHDGAAGAAA